MELAQFLEEAPKSESILPQETPVPVDALKMVLKLQKHVGDMADVVKRNIFYGEDPVIVAKDGLTPAEKFSNARAEILSDLTAWTSNSHRLLNAKNPTDLDLQLAHVNLGMITEVGEFTSDVLQPPAIPGSLPLDNMLVEIVDFMWYVAVWCKKYNMSLEQGFDIVIAKLRKRMGGEAFDATKCLNRDLEAEEQAMEEAAHINEVTPFIK